MSSRQPSEDRKRICGAERAGAEGAQLSAIQPFPTVERGGGKGRRTNKKSRPKGSRAASNREKEIRNGRVLSAEKGAVLKLVARFIVHFENASNRLYREGETREDGEAKQLLDKTLPGLFDRITGGLRYAFGEEHDGEPSW